MRKVFSYLGVASSSISLVLLIQYGFHFGIAAPFLLIIDFYRFFVDLILRPLEPAVRGLLVVFRKFIHIDVRVYPYWKHILVPMWLYVAADARITWLMGGVERRISTLAIVVHGGLIALVSSIAAATVPLDIPSYRFIIVPVAGLTVYNTIQALWDSTFHRVANVSWWAAFRFYLLRMVLSDAVLGVLVVVVGSVILQGEPRNVNILLLIALVTLLAARHLALSVWDAIKTPDLSRMDMMTNLPRQEAWITRVRASAHTRLGFLILKSVGGAALFLVCNAGYRALT